MKPKGAALLENTVIIYIKLVLQLVITSFCYLILAFSPRVMLLDILAVFCFTLNNQMSKIANASKLERQLMMQNEMRERQMALQIAWSREFLKYFGTFFGIAAISLTAGAVRRRKPAFLFPVIPLGFVFTYQYDLGYGTLLQRMRGEAEDILETEKSKLQLPRGMITFESLEKARKEQSKFFIDK